MDFTKHPPAITLGEPRHNAAQVGANMKKRIIFTLAIFAEVGLYAISPRAHAAESDAVDGCSAAAPIKAAFEAKHGRWITVTTDQFNFLRGIYALNPNTAPGLPPGGSAVLAQVEGTEDAGGVVFFISGDLACTPMTVVAPLVKMMREVEGSRAPREGVPM